MSFLSSLLSNLNNKITTNTAPKVYLQNNSNRIQFPVPPAAFEISVKQNNSTININNIGEFNMLGKTGLIQMSFSSFFPNQQYTFCQCTPDDPYSYVKKIDSWRTSGKPSRFIVSGTPINYAVSIDSFKWGEKDGTGDVYFTVDFKEYKFIGGAADSTQVNEVTGMKERADSSAIENALTNMTVYPGDSIGDVIGRAVGRNASLGSNDTNILAAYKKLAKSGGIKAGDVVTYTATNNILKVNDKIV